METSIMKIEIDDEEIEIPIEYERNKDSSLRGVPEIT
jgi:hypothetical protein